MKEQRFEYDVQKRARAGTAATLRAVISLYIIYLAWSILKGVRNGSSPVPVWVGWLTAIVFTAGAVAFGVYTWKTYLRDREAARLPVLPEEERNGEAETEEEQE